MKNISLLIFITVLLSGSCGPNNKKPMVWELNTGWKFRDTRNSHWMQATVPGTVHRDLISSGIIKHPYVKYNEDSVQWVETRDWEYSCRFILPGTMLKRKQIDLVFEGLDTYADIYLNDTLLGKTDNMFVGYTFHIKNLIRRDTNELRIFFHSPVKTGLKKLLSLPYTLKATNEQAPENRRTNVFTRKAPFHYGWDWGPRLVTSGIWKPVTIRAWDKAIMKDVYLKARNISASRAVYTASMTILSALEDHLECQVSVNGHTVAVCPVKNIRAGDNLIKFDFEIQQPRLWWTHNLGEPYLYTVKLSLLKRNRSIDEKTIRLGIRSLELVQEPDSAGRSFFFRLNGVPVFMKGANYIPPDILSPVAADSAYYRVLNDAREAHMNMLRVWGGAVYESDKFYDLCDELGILVWQDFMFACALMPPFRQHLQNIRNEAEYTVKRLRNHACLALWCGNNENLIAWHTWGWKNHYSPEISERLWKTYKNIFYKILPDAVSTYDGQRAYWASSPSSYNNMIPDRLSGDEHDWSIWFGQKPFDEYQKNIPRFVSEYGLQSFPDTSTLLFFSSHDDWSYRSKIFEHRQRSLMPWISETMNGNEMIKKYINLYFRKARDFPSFVYLSQVMQAEGLCTAVNAHRRSMPHCMGSLYWQLDDCWPAISWSTVDYFGNWKAAHYLLKKAFANIRVIPVTEQEEIKIYLVSDLLQPVPAVLKIKSMNFDGRTILSDSISINIQPNQSAVYYCDSRSNIMKKADPASSFVYVELIPHKGQAITNTLFFRKNKDLNLTPPDIKKTVNKISDYYQVRIVSNCLARYACVTSDIKGRFSDNYFDLIPGQPTIIDFFPAVAQKNSSVPEFAVTTLIDSYR